MELTDLDIKNLKDKFIKLLRDTKREGMEDLIRFRRFRFFYSTFKH